MSSRASSKPKALQLLLAIEILLAIFAILLLLRLDYIIHYALYSFGLQFSYEWAQQYWTYVRVIWALLGSSAVLGCGSVAYIRIRERTRTPLRMWALGIPRIVSTTLVAISVLVLLQLDLFVHSDLYRYGLQFSFEWAQQYWAIERFCLSLNGLVILLDCIFVGYLTAGRAHARVSFDKIMASLLLTSGAIALFFSIVYESAIPAFIGLSLILWGALMFYAKPQESIRQSMLATLVWPATINLDMVIRSLEYEGKAVYLPPQYSKDIESGILYISKQEGSALPTPDKTEKYKGLFLHDPEGMLISPPAAELTSLFERALGASFTQANLKQIMRTLPKIFLEDLEIAKNFEIEERNGLLHLRIEGLFYKDENWEPQEIHYICRVLNHPIVSAIASAFAKAIGKPIVVEKEHIGEGGRTIEAEYRTLEA